MPYAAVYTPEPSQPSGGPMPGAVALLNFAVGEWDDADFHDDSASLGIYNPRDVCGNQWPNWECAGSQHARGAAGDASFPVVRPGGHPEGTRLAAWLVTHYLDLGVQEVIWAGRRWSNLTKEWRAYTGRSDHFDHVHFALTAAAAQSLTMATIYAVYRPTPMEDDDMALILRGNDPARPARLLAGPVASLISAADRAELEGKGVISIVVDDSTYDAMKAQLDKILA